MLVVSSLGCLLVARRGQLTLAVGVFVRARVFNAKKNAFLLSLSVLSFEHDLTVIVRVLCAWICFYLQRAGGDHELLDGLAERQAKPCPHHHRRRRAHGRLHGLVGEFRVARSRLEMRGLVFVS